MIIFAIADHSTVSRSYSGCGSADEALFAAHNGRQTVGIVFETSWRQGAPTVECVSFGQIASVATARAVSPYHGLGLGGPHVAPAVQT